MNVWQLFNLQGTLFLMILAGVVLKKIGVLDASGKKTLTDLCVDIVIPCNIVKSFLVGFQPDVIRACAGLLVVGFLLQILCVVFNKFLFNRYAEQIAIAKDAFGLADNAPGVYSLMNVASVREFSGMGMYLGIASALIVAAALIRSRRKMTNEILLLAGLLLACGLPLILPQMNARSLYLAGMLAFCCAGNARRFAVAVVLEFVSLCSYMQSIFNVTIMPMSVLSLIAIAIAAVVAVDLITLIMTPEEAEA